jgi:predicted dinucleotide-binding enzyme
LVTSDKVVQVIAESGSSFFKNLLSENISEIVFLLVPGDAALSTVQSLGSALDGKILIGLSMFEE